MSNRLRESAARAFARAASRYGSASLREEPDAYVIRIDDDGESFEVGVLKSFDMDSTSDETLDHIWDLQMSHVIGHDE